MYGLGQGRQLILSEKVEHGRRGTMVPAWVSSKACNIFRVGCRGIRDAEDCRREQLPPHRQPNPTAHGPRSGRPQRGHGAESAELVHENNGPGSSVRSHGCIVVPVDAPCREPGTKSWRLLQRNCVYCREDRRNSLRRMKFPNCAFKCD